MKAEIISTGTEILLGQTLNTNAHYLTWKLSSIGIEVDYHTTVGDNPERLEAVLRAALKRSDLVIATGGTGTTADDLTKKIAAKILNVPMVLDENCLKRLEDFFAQKQRTLTEEDHQLAYVPQGARVFLNRHGTAPGVMLTCDSKYLIILPGPPLEMQPMFEQDVFGILQSMVGAHQERMFVRVLKVFGLDEKGLERQFAPLMSRENPVLTLLSKHTEMHVRIVARSRHQDEAERLLDQTEQEIRAILGSKVYGKDDDTLIKVVMSALKRNRLTISTAESCTGGLLGGILTEQPGSSAVFWGGVISYDNSVKERLLGVDSEIIKRVGAVSPEVAEAMATGVRRLIGSDIAIGITGIAGPDGGTKEKPVGLVYIGMATDHGVRVERFQFVGDRQSIRQLAVHNALNIVREYLQEIERSI